MLDWVKYKSRGYKQYRVIVDGVKYILGRYDQPLLYWVTVQGNSDMYILASGNEEEAKVEAGYLILSGHIVTESN